MRRKRIAQFYGLCSVIAFGAMIVTEGGNHLFYALPGYQSWFYGIRQAFAAEGQVWQFLSIPLGFFGLLSPVLLGAAVWKASSREESSLLKVLLVLELLLTAACALETPEEWYLFALGGVWDALALLLLPRENPGAIHWKRWGCVLVMAAAFCLACARLPAAVTPNPLTVLSEELEADIQGSILRDADTHGGFLGDGDRVVEIQVTDAGAFLNSLEGSPYWHSLPLSANVHIALYEMDGFPEEAVFPGHGMPRVEDGLWFFRDRSSESQDPASDRNLHSRYSYNFTAAIYDTKTNKLYVMEQDT